MVMLVAQIALGIFTALTAAQVACGDHPSDRCGLLVGADHPGAASGGLSGGRLNPKGNGMKNNTAYAELMAYQRQTEALGKVAERLGWDQETMMPRGAADQRGEEMAAIEGVLHARRTDPQIAQWLADAEAADAGGHGADSPDRRGLIAGRQGAGRSGAGIGAGDIAGAGDLGRARAADKVADFLPTLTRGDRSEAARGGLSGAGRRSL